MTVPYLKPLPAPDPLLAPFWDHARRNELAAQTCDSCGDTHFPPSPVCPRCLGSAQHWQKLSGRGTLQSWIDFHRAYWPGFAGELPYRVCIVELAEGPVLASNLVGDSAGARLGAPVRVVFDKVTNEWTLPKFELV